MLDLADNPQVNTVPCQLQQGPTAAAEGVMIVLTSGALQLLSSERSV